MSYFAGYLSRLESLHSVALDGATAKKEKKSKSNLENSQQQFVAFTWNFYLNLRALLSATLVTRVGKLHFLGSYFNCTKTLPWARLSFHAQNSFRFQRKAFINILSNCSQFQKMPLKCFSTHLLHIQIGEQLYQLSLRRCHQSSDKLACTQHPTLPRTTSKPQSKQEMCRTTNMQKGSPI